MTYKTELKKLEDAISIHMLRAEHDGAVSSN